MWCLVYTTSQIWNVKLLLETTYYLLITSFTAQKYEIMNDIVHRTIIDWYVIIWYFIKWFNLFFLEQNYTTRFWLIITEYTCQNWARVCFVCRNHNPILSPFMTNHQVFNMSNTTEATCGAGTAYSPSTAFTPDF